MYVRIEVGEYGGISLDDWVKQVDNRISFLEQRIFALENTIDKIKKIVPLVDDELGMNQPPSQVVE